MDEQRLLPTEVVAGEDDLHLGLVPSALPPGIVFVQKVDLGSWAERVGVQVGSEIRAINGKDVATMKGEAFRIHLKKRPIQFMLLPRSDAEKNRAEEERRRAEEDLRRLEEERKLFAKVREGMDEERRQMDVERKRMEEERQRIEEERRRAEADLKLLQERLAREEEERRLEELRRLAEDKKNQEEEERKKKLAEENQAAEEKRAAWLKEQEEAMRRMREEDEKRRQDELEARRRACELEKKRREEELLRLQKERLLADSLGPAPWDYGSYHAAKPVQVASGQRASVRLHEELPETRKRLEYQVTVNASASVLGIIPCSWPPHEVCVGSVVANSAAAEQGVQVGDVLVTLDGELAKKMSRSVLDSLLRKRPLVLGMTRCVSDVPSDVRNGSGKESRSGGIAEAGNYMLNFTFDDRVLGFIPGTWPPGPVQISGVVPDSSAHRLGVRAGDALVCLNDRDVMGMHRRELLAALRERPLKLVFLRGPGLQTVAQHLATDAITEAMDEAFLPDFSYTTDGAFMTTWDPPHIREQQQEQLASMKIQMQKPKEQLTLAQRAIRYGASVDSDVPKEVEKEADQGQHQPEEVEREEQQHQQEELQQHQQQQENTSLAELGEKLIVSGSGRAVDLERSTKKVVLSPRRSQTFPSSKMDEKSEPEKRPSPTPSPNDSPYMSPGMHEPDVEPMPQGAKTPPAPVPRLNLDGVGNGEERSNKLQKKVKRTRNAAFVAMLGEFAADQTGEEGQKVDKPNESQTPNKSLQKVRRADRAVSLLQGLTGRSDHADSKGITADSITPNQQGNVEQNELADEQRYAKILEEEAGRSRTMEKDHVELISPDGRSGAHEDPSLTNMTNNIPQVKENDPTVSATSKRLRKVRQLDIMTMLQSDSTRLMQRADGATVVEPLPVQKDVANAESLDRPGDMRETVRKVKKLNIAALVSKGVTEDSAAMQTPKGATATTFDISKIPGGDGSGPRKTVFLEVSATHLYGHSMSLGITLRHDNLIVIGFEVKQARDTWRLGDKIEALNGITVANISELGSEFGLAKSRLAQHPIVFAVSRVTWGMDPAPKWTVSTDTRSSVVEPAGLSCPEPGTRPLATPQKRVNGLKTAKEWLKTAQQPQEVEYEKVCTCGNTFIEDSVFCQRCGTRRPTRLRPASPKPSRVAGLLDSSRPETNIRPEPEPADSTWDAADREFQMQRLAKIRSAVADCVADVRSEEEEAVLADLEAAAFLLELGADPNFSQNNAQRREEQDVDLAAAALLAELSPSMETLHEDWERQQVERTTARRTPGNFQHELQVTPRQNQDRLKYSVRV